MRGHKRALTIAEHQSQQGGGAGKLVDNAQVARRAKTVNVKLRLDKLAGDHGDNVYRRPTLEGQPVCSQWWCTEQLLANNVADVPLFMRAVDGRCVACGQVRPATS